MRDAGLSSSEVGAWFLPSWQQRPEAQPRGSGLLSGHPPGGAQPPGRGADAGSCTVRDERAPGLPLLLELPGTPCHPEPGEMQGLTPHQTH